MHVFLRTNFQVNFWTRACFGYKFSLVLCYGDNVEPAAFERSGEDTSMSSTIDMAVRSSRFQLCYVDTPGSPGSLKQVTNFAEGVVLDFLCWWERLP